MKKRLARILAVTLGAATLLTGCGGNSGQKTSDSSKKSDDQKITEDVTKTEGEIEVWTNLSQEEMNFYVEEFNKIVPGVKVKVTVMPSKEYRTKLQNAFRTGTNAPDVATFEISDLGVYKETDMLENLSQEKYGAEDISKDMIPYVDELSRDKEGDIRGLSWQSTPGGFWYKKALAKEYLGTDDPDELAAMLSDWDKIVEVGKQVYEKSDGKIALLDDVESVLQLYASYKGQPWVDDNNHIISDDYMLEMYKMMETVVSNKVDAEADMWSAGWTSGMYSKDMFILTCLPTWGLNFCIKPGIPDDEMDKAANTWGDFPGYIPAIEKCIEEGHTDIVTGDQQYFADFYETAKEVKGDPMTKYDRQAWTSAGAQMDLIATGQITPEEAVQGFKEDMKNIYPEIEID